jgi:hypothetical protein
MEGLAWFVPFVLSQQRDHILNTEKALGKDGLGKDGLEGLMGDWPSRVRDGFVFLGRVERTMTLVLGLLEETNTARRTQLEYLT